MRDFQIIAFTSPDSVKHEIEKIKDLIGSGAIDVLHLRKPDMPESEIENILSRLPENVINKIRLHSAFRLSEKFHINGIHLNSRNPLNTTNIKKQSWLSRSCHSLEEAKETILEDKYGSYKYVTLSPIFNSISKMGYSSNFQLDKIRNNLPNRCVALGGVTPDLFQKLKDCGFYGAALLGWLWSDNETEINKKIDIIINLRSSLHT